MKKQAILKTIVTILLVTFSATYLVSAQRDSTLQKTTIAANISEGKTPATQSYDWRLWHKPPNSICLRPFGLAMHRFTGDHLSMNDQGSPYYLNVSLGTIRLFNHTTH